MKSYVVVNDIDGLKFAVENDLEFAYMVGDAKLHQAVRDLARKYSGGCQFDFFEEHYKYMYIDK